MGRELLLSFLLIIGILICGCSTPISETATINPPSDSIVGIWTQDLTTSEDVSPYIVTITFLKEGNFTFQDRDGSYSGQWIKIRENQYIVSFSFTKETETYIYDPATDTLYQPEYSILKIYRACKMPAPTIKVATASITNSPQSSNRYKQGDEIQRATTDSAYDKDRAWVILKVDYNEGKYTVGKLYYDPDARQWFKLNDDLPEVRFFSAVERDYPNLLGSINWDTVPTKYLIKDCDGNNVLSYNSKPPDCPSGEQLKDGTLSGYGDDVITLDVKTSSLYIFTMTHSGRANFIVWVKDNEGYNEDLLVNEIGHYSGRKSIRLEKGIHYLDITADGTWTIGFSS